MLIKVALTAVLAVLIGSHAAGGFRLRQFLRPALPGRPVDGRAHELFRTGLAGRRDADPAAHRHHQRVEWAWTADALLSMNPNLHLYALDQRGAGATDLPAYRSAAGQSPIYASPAPISPTICWRS